MVPDVWRKVAIALFSSLMRVGQVPGHWFDWVPQPAGQPAAEGFVGSSIEPELSTNIMTLGLSRLLATMFLSVVCATARGTTRSKS